MHSLHAAVILLNIELFTNFPGIRVFSAAEVCDVFIEFLHYCYYEKMFVNTEKYRLNNSQHSEGK